MIRYIEDEVWAIASIEFQIEFDAWVNEMYARCGHCHDTMAPSVMSTHAEACAKRPTCVECGDAMKEDEPLIVMAGKIFDTIECARIRSGNDLVNS